MIESLSSSSPDERRPDTMPGAEVMFSRELVNELQFRMGNIEERQKGIYQIFGREAVGNSSFRDVFINRIGVCKSDIRYLVSLLDNLAEAGDDAQETMESVNRNLGYVERYLTLLESFPEYLQAELSSHGGMFPDISEKADELTSKGVPINRINYYIEQSEQRITPSSRKVH